MRGLQSRRRSRTIGRRRCARRRLQLKIGSISTKRTAGSISRSRSTKTSAIFSKRLARRRWPAIAPAQLPRHSARSPKQARRTRTKWARSSTQLPVGEEPRRSNGEITTVSTERTASLCVLCGLRSDSFYRFSSAVQLVTRVIGFTPSIFDRFA